jgi:uncharacterized protein with FMN-binding domain
MNIVPKRGIIGGTITAIALALILSFKTPTTTGLPAAGGGGQVQGGSTGGSQATQGTGTGTGTGSTKSTYSGTLTGQAIQIPFGTVQVQVTMQGGQITDVQALQMPQDQFHSQQISSYAGPQLRSEALQAQSAQINTISGATYTSEGYIQSLQSALDQIPA